MNDGMTSLSGIDLMMLTVCTWVLAFGIDRWLHRMYAGPRAPRAGHRERGGDAPTSAFVAPKLTAPSSPATAEVDLQE